MDGALAALAREATGVKPYFVGKPTPLMMRSALNRLGAQAEDVVIIDDRMDTDIVAGMEAGMDTILVLSGVARQQHIDRYAYRPTRVVASVADIELA